MANEQNLKPFPKGVSGNPAGKPKGTEHSKTRLKRILDLVQKKKNPITGQEEEFTVLELMDMQMIAKALRGDQKAYQEVIDRLEGKPKQTSEVEVSGGMTINWEEKKTYVQNTGSL
jgi:Family of unknown function (DUF5681)